MQDETYEPVDPVTARNQYAALYRHAVGELDPEVIEFAQRKVATARIDHAIRKAFRDYPVDLHPAQIAYLTGVLQTGGAQ